MHFLGQKLLKDQESNFSNQEHPKQSKDKKKKALCPELEQEKIEKTEANSDKNRQSSLDVSEIITKKSMRIFDDLDKKTHILLENTEISIGRGPANTISKPKLSIISLNHSRIFSLNSFAFIQDKGSTNGTYLKLIPNKPYRIKNKMELEIGEMLYSFERSKKIPEIFKIKSFDGEKTKKSLRIDKKKKFYLISKEEKNEPHALNLGNLNIQDDQAYILLIKNKFHIMPLESKFG